MTRELLLFGLGVAFAAAVGFLCPVWYLGFLPLSAGLIWAAYEIVDEAEVGGGDTAAPPK